MSLGSALYTAVSGVQSFGNAMNPIGDNIANLGAVGFKGSRVVFADIIAAQVANGLANLQFGRGTLINAIQPRFTQGAFETTGNSTDMAIQGNGFFVLRHPTFAEPSFYTRAGNFILDNKGSVVSHKGYHLQGYRISNVSPTGFIKRAGSPQDITISGIQSVPKSTEYFRASTNLMATTETGQKVNTSMNLYNAIGETVPITIEFTKSATPLEWSWIIKTPQGTTASGSAASGVMQFSPQGEIVSPVTDLDLVISGFSSGAAPINAKWDLFDDNKGLAYKEITSYAAESVTNSIVQDGYTTGVLRAISVDEEGVIAGLFSNGQTQKLWQIELAEFISPWSLSRQGDSLFGETVGSGQPVKGIPNSGSFGNILGGTLEMSNVDLAEQFVEMIKTQKGFQANSRSISVMDELTKEVINLIR